MPTKTYSINEIAKLKQLVTEGVQVSQEIQDLREGLGDTVKAVAQEMEIKAATLNKAIKDIFKELINYKFKVTILLAPACSSFDQFNNFEDRGNLFKKIIIKKFNQ